MLSNYDKQVIIDSAYKQASMDKEAGKVWDALNKNVPGTYSNRNILTTPLPKGSDVKHILATGALTSAVIAGHLGGYPEVNKYQDMRDEFPKSMQGVQRLLDKLPR